MEQINEYQGLCPLCYKPVLRKDELTAISHGYRSENYHAVCVQKWLAQKQEEGHSTEASKSLLEKFSHLFINTNRNRVLEWMNTQACDWWTTGETMRNMRASIGLSHRTAASYLGISVARLKRFEAGKPVRDAKLLYNSYLMLISGHNTMCEHLQLKHAHMNLYNDYQVLSELYSKSDDAHQCNQEREAECQ